MPYRPVRSAISAIASTRDHFCWYVILTRSSVYYVIVPRHCIHASLLEASCRQRTKVWWNCLLRDSFFFCESWSIFLILYVPTNHLFMTTLRFSLVSETPSEWHVVGNFTIRCYVGDKETSSRLAWIQWREHSWIHTPLSWEPCCSLCGRWFYSCGRPRHTTRMSQVTAARAFLNRAPSPVSKAACESLVKVYGFLLVHHKTTQVRMYDRSGTRVHCCICAQQTLPVHSPGGDTFPCEITSWPPSWKRKKKFESPHQQEQAE